MYTVTTEKMTDGQVNLRALLHQKPLEVKILDELDERTLKFLHATVTETDEEMKRRIIETTTESVSLSQFDSSFIQMVA